MDTLKTYRINTDKFYYPGDISLKNLAKNLLQGIIPKDELSEIDSIKIENLTNFKAIAPIVVIGEDFVIIHRSSHYYTIYSNRVLNLTHPLSCEISPENTFATILNLKGFPVNINTEKHPIFPNETGCTLFIDFRPKIQGSIHFEIDPLNKKQMKGFSATLLRQI